MTHYNLLVLGFGKAGKTLAKYAAAQGQHVALVEQSSDNYGGTCINVQCVYFHKNNPSISTGLEYLIRTS
ncbi:pyridine nucleotide-disulfide oxidoreductase [Staphylococcus haemolyticus]|nr:pyridine nucleotide-disulfide oxidoreductase [Staphylococcus haemolyticus]